VDNRITVVVTSCDRQDRHDLLIIDTRISFPLPDFIYSHRPFTDPDKLGARRGDRRQFKRHSFVRLFGHDTVQIASRLSES
jgi:hypothetical protein